MKSLIKEIMAMKRMKYIIGVTLLAIFAIALNAAFSAFTVTNQRQVANITVAGFDFFMSIDNNPGRIVNSCQGTSLKDIEIISLNERAARYELTYRVCSDASCTSFIPTPNNFEVKFSSLTLNEVYGEIAPNATIVIRVAIINNTNQCYHIQFDINSGFVHNTLTREYDIVNEYNESSLDGVLRAESVNATYFLFGPLRRDRIEGITFTNTAIPPSNAIDYWDVSSEQNNSVIAWRTPAGTNPSGQQLYNLYIGASGGVIANPVSSFLFRNTHYLESLNIDWLDTSGATSMTSMFNESGRNVDIFDIDLTNLDTSRVTSMNGMFISAGRNATTLNIEGLSTWNTSNVRNMTAMFSDVGRYATTLNIEGLSTWDTSSVTTMASMFSSTGRNATTWNIGDLSTWDTSSVTTMASMFSSTGQNATTWNIGDLSTWDTSSVTTMASMFANAGLNSANSNLDLTGWDTSSVTNMAGMFVGAWESATTWSVGDIGTWDISSVTIMQTMFANAGLNSANFNLDLTGWDILPTTIVFNMFSNINPNARIYVSTPAMETRIRTGTGMPASVTVVVNP